MSEAIDAGIGHNSAATAPTLQEMLDPEMIADQLKLDYAAHIRKRNELIPGVARFCLRYSTSPRGDVLPESPKAGQTFIHDSGSDTYLMTWLGSSEGWKRVAAPETIRRLLPTVFIPDEEAQERATSFVRQLKDVRKLVEADRKKEKTPYDNAADAVQDFFRPLIDMLDTAASWIERGPMTAFVNRKIAEERRLREEEAAAAIAAAEVAAAAAKAAQTEDVIDTAIVASQAADKAQKRAAAPVADLGRTRGAVGGVTSARTVWLYEVIDESKLPREFWLINEAKLAQIAKTDKAAASVPGVRFYSEVKAQV